EVKGGTVCVDTNSDDSATSCIAAESDIRLKKNIQPIENALDKISQLKGVTFDWRWDEYDEIQKYSAKPHGIGLIGQNVKEVFPEAMNENMGEFNSVDYKVLVAPLIEAIKEQQTQIKALEAKIQALEALSSQELGNSKELISENSAGEISRFTRNDKEESEFSLIKWLELVIRKLFVFLNPLNYLAQN
ncbi:tail fiber domain-containing protein, partial [Patescibacteria group bacterium AH-259-L07]|nr:tail fiber domain-containing protein [Patescibacteria group bacterium AH-259-L07]